MWVTLCSGPTKLDSSMILWPVYVFRKFSEQRMNFNIWNDFDSAHAYFYCWSWIWEKYFRYFWINISLSKELFFTFWIFDIHSYLQTVNHLFFISFLAWKNIVKSSKLAESLHKKRNFSGYFLYSNRQTFYLIFQSSSMGNPCWIGLVQLW